MECVPVSILENNINEYPFKVYQIINKKRILIDLSNNFKESRSFYYEFQMLFPALKFELVINDRPYS